MFEVVSGIVYGSYPKRKKPEGKGFPVFSF